MNISVLRKSKTKSRKTLSFKNLDNLNNDLNTKESKNNKEKEDYTLDFKKDKMSFMNEEEQEGYCVNKYDNGDAYFGFYAKDLRNLNGFYYYNPIYENGYTLNRSYFGMWKDDLRHGFGIYLWAKEENNKKFYEDFESSKFKAYVGNFKSDKLDKGTYLSKDNDDYFVYHGTFSENNKKEGNNCFYYTANLELLLYGTFHENEFIRGYIAKFDDEGEIWEIKLYNNGKAEILEKSNEIEKVNLMTTFRDVIMSEDYFGTIFEVFSNVLKCKEDYLFDIDIVNSDKYTDFMELCKSYKKIKIYNDIEKYVKYN